MKEDKIYTVSQVIKKLKMDINVFQVCRILREHGILDINDQVKQSYIEEGYFAPGRLIHDGGPNGYSKYEILVMSQKGIKFIKDKVKYFVERKNYKPMPQPNIPYHQLYRYM